MMFMTMSSMSVVFVIMTMSSMPSVSVIIVTMSTSMTVPVVVMPVMVVVIMSVSIVRRSVMSVIVLLVSMVSIVSMRVMTGLGIVVVRSWSLHTFLMYFVGGVIVIFFCLRSVCMCVGSMCGVRSSGMRVRRFWFGYFFWQKRGLDDDHSRETIDTIVTDPFLDHLEKDITLFEYIFGC